MRATLENARVLGVGEYGGDVRHKAAEGEKLGELVAFLDVYDDENGEAMRFPVDQPLRADALKLTFGQVLNLHVSLRTERRGTATGNVAEKLKGRVVGLDGVPAGKAA